MNDNGEVVDDNDDDDKGETEEEDLTYMKVFKCFCSV